MILACVVYQRDPRHSFNSASRVEFIFSQLFLTFALASRFLQIAPFSLFFSRWYRRERNSKREITSRLVMDLE